MKVVSWNIAGCHKFHGKVQDSVTYGSEDLDYFTDVLQNSNADFIGLQEALIPLSKDDKTQTELIAEELGFGYSADHGYGPSHFKKDNLLALGNISKYRIQKTYFHLLPNPKISFKRPDGNVWVTFDVGILVSEVEYHNLAINVANLHLSPLQYFVRDLKEPALKPHRDDINQFLLSLLDKPTLVIGDFNYDNLKSALPELFENDNYAEAFENTETAPGKGQRDHILYSQHWKLKNANIEKFETDHYLCQAELELI